jgi:aminopeptidase N
VVRAISTGALETFGEKRAVAALERAASREPDVSVQRRMRTAAKKLNAGDKTDDQLKQLRQDLDQIREENRKLKEQIGSLEAKIK